MSYADFIKKLVKLEKDGVIDMSARYEMMNMGLELSHASFVRGQDEGIKTMDRISKM